MLKQLSPSGSVDSARYIPRHIGSRYTTIHHYSPLLRGIVVYYLLKVLINVGKLNDLPGGGVGGGGVLDQWPVGIGDPLTLTLFTTKKFPKYIPCLGQHPQF